MVEKGSGYIAHLISEMLLRADAGGCSEEQYDFMYLSLRYVDC